MKCILTPHSFSLDSPIKVWVKKPELSLDDLRYIVWIFWVHLKCWSIWASHERINIWPIKQAGLVWLLCIWFGLAWNLPNSLLLLQLEGGGISLPVVVVSTPRLYTTTPPLFKYRYFLGEGDMKNVLFWPQNGPRCRSCHLRGQKSLGPLEKSRFCAGTI